MSETLGITPDQYVQATFPTPAPLRTEVEGISELASANIQPAVSPQIYALVQRIFLNLDKPVRSVVFSGVARGNGASEVCAATATLLAQNVGSVCLVEADINQPLAQLLGVSDVSHMPSCLDSDQPIRAFLRCVDDDRLFLLPAKALRTKGSLLFAERSLQARLKELGQEVSFIVVCAPLASSMETLLLAKLVDGVVLLIEANRTRRDSASDVVDSLRSAHINILAAVLNNQTFPLPQALNSGL